MTAEEKRAEKAILEAKIAMLKDELAKAEKRLAELKAQVG